jgi:hypothetical protein
VQANGSVTFKRQTIAADQSGVYPALAIVSDAVVLAWTSGPAGQTRLRTERLAF